jgi:hypothetical protein
LGSSKRNPLDVLAQAGNALTQREMLLLKKFEKMLSEFWTSLEKEMMDRSLAWLNRVKAYMRAALRKI